MPRFHPKLTTLQRRAASVPRHVGADMRASLRANPRGALYYDVLVDDLTAAMIRAYQLGVNDDGSTLTRFDRAEKELEYRKQARAMLVNYQVNANKQIKAAYDKAIDAGKSHGAAVSAVLRRFRTLGMNAPVTNKMRTVYDTATYGAFSQGLHTASQNDQKIVGYRYWTQEDERVRHPTHTQFNRVSLPKDDPFWKQYWPPIAWNCRCFIQPLKRKPAGGWVQPPKNPVPVNPGYSGIDFQLF